MPNPSEFKGVILVILLTLAVAIGSVLITREPTIIDTTTPTAAPTRQLVTRATPVIAITNPHAGRWMGRGFTSQSPNYPPLQLFFDVTVDGTLTGVLSLYPSNPEIPRNAVDLIAKNGCNVEFDTFEGSINGYFASFMEAFVEVEATRCQVKFFGEITLLEPVRGVFVAEYSESATAQLYQPDAPLTPLERGIGAFLNYCSACHGSYAEGAPGIPSLNTPEAQAKTDEELLTIIKGGVINTVMPAWGNVLTEEERQGIMLLIRDLTALRRSK